MAEGKVVGCDTSVVCVSVASAKSFNSLKFHFWSYYLTFCEYRIIVHILAFVILLIGLGGLYFLLAVLIQIYSNLVAAILYVKSRQDKQQPYSMYTLGAQCFNCQIQSDQIHLLWLNTKAIYIDGQIHIDVAIAAGFSMKDAFVLCLWTLRYMFL